MQEVLTFKNDQFGQVRTVNHNNGIWFVAVDVCKVLGLSNTSKTLLSLDNDEKANFKLAFGSAANIINESGLYTLIMQSRKPNAKPFRKWVTSEVLPAIRETGQYSVKSPRPTYTPSNWEATKTEGLYRWKKGVSNPLLLP